MSDLRWQRENLEVSLSNRGEIGRALAIAKEHLRIAENRRDQAEIKIREIDARLGEAETGEFRS